jgi:hypothetical protein
MRSECGARARSRKPLPGGSGPPLGRHHDRSPRSSVDSRQIKAGNARQIGSQETRELELSQRRMRSPWRVPRRSAERRAARDKSRCRAADELRKFAHTCLRCADMDGAPIGAPPPFFVRMISSENRTPLFGIVRGEASFFVRLVVRKARMQRTHRENDFVCLRITGEVEKRTITAHSRESGNPVWVRPRGDERRNRKGQPPCPPNIRTACDRRSGGGRRSAYATGCSRSRSTMRSVIGARAPIGAAIARAVVRITNAIGGAWSK